MIMTPTSARVIIEPGSASEDNETDISIAKNGKLFHLFEQPIPPFRESHLPTCRIIDPIDYNLPSPHTLPFIKLINEHIYSIRHKKKKKQEIEEDVDQIHSFP